MTALTVRARYNLIESAVRTEVNRLLPHPDYQGSTRIKAQKINSALDRLYLVIMKTNPKGTSIPARYAFKKINPQEATTFNLSTIDSMLDANISEWESDIPPSTEQGMEFNGRRAGYASQISLRTALNIANNNFFNFFGGSWGPLWGEANALENVKIELGIK